jgi:hypothetical protein
LRLCGNSLAFILYFEMSSTPVTPRSRAGSRSRTSSRLTVPQLRPTHSLSNLHGHAHRTPSPSRHSPSLHAAAAASAPTIPHDTALDSSASSVAEAEGILVQDAGADLAAIDDGEISAVGTLAAGSSDEDSKKTLRDQLRKTLSQKTSFSGEIMMSAAPISLP